ncbi:DUF1090 family protein [Pseudomonas sp. NPDC007930]|uniref:DUF1090 family protein n=1 Tax=Pseudomonas sp. NPDC007930 TaxID=3364417 RepID=UPI0036EE7FED
MKSIVCAMLLAGLASSSVYGAQPTGCAAQEQEIRNKLATASPWAKPGLEKALGEQQEHCSDSNLRAEREAKVNAAQAKVQTRQQKLAEERDPKDIPKRQAELKDAQGKLEAAQRELNR